MAEVEATKTSTQSWLPTMSEYADGEVGVQIDPTFFTATSLDEASVLAWIWHKDYQEFLPFFAGVQQVRSHCQHRHRTDTKSWLHYAGYLGVMDTGQAWHDSSSVTVRKPTTWHCIRERAGVLVVGVNVGGVLDEAVRPRLSWHWVWVATVERHRRSGERRQWNCRVFRWRWEKDVPWRLLGLADAAKEKRDSINSRVQRVVEIINRPRKQRRPFPVVARPWSGAYRIMQGNTQNARRCMVRRMMTKPTRLSATSRMVKLKYLQPKRNAWVRVWISKYHCHKAIMFIDYRFNDKYQAIARIPSFHAKVPLPVDVYRMQREQEILRRSIWNGKQHKDMVEKMVQIVRDNGLFGLDVENKLMRYMHSQREGIER